MNTRSEREKFRNFRNLLDSNIVMVKLISKLKPKKIAINYYVGNLRREVHDLTEGESIFLSDII